MTIVEVYRHLCRKHYSEMRLALYAMRLAAMYGHRGRMESCTVCGQRIYLDRRKP